MRKSILKSFILLTILSTTFVSLGISSIPTAQAALEPRPAITTSTVEEVEAKAAELRTQAQQNATRAAENLNKAQIAYNDCNVFCSAEEFALKDATSANLSAQARLAEVNTWMDEAEAAANQDPPDFETANQKLTSADRVNYVSSDVNSRAEGSMAAAKNECFHTESGDIFPTIHLYNCVTQVASIVAYISLTVCGFILGFCSLIFDKVIEYSVLNMKTNIDGLSSINDAWRILRDLANMGFIFVLLYIAVNTILGRNNGQIKAMLGKVIIVGLLINFSLFFTKMIIDGSNILTLGFYNLAVANNSATEAPGGPCVSGALPEFVCSGLSKKIMIGAGISTVYSGMTGTDPSATGAVDTRNGFEKITIIGIGGSIMVLVTAFTIITAAWLFIVRYVVLIFLMVLAPVAFIAWTLPGMQGTARKWWDTLLGQVIFAPLYMAMFWVVFLLLDNLGTTLRGGKSIAKALSPTESVTNISIILNFILVIIFLHVTAKIAKSYATSGAAIVGKVGNWGANKIESVRNGAARTTRDTAQATAQKVAAAPVAIGAGIARGTVGRYNYNQLQKRGDDLRNQAAAGDLKAKAELEKLERRAAGSYDLRASKLGAKIGLDKAMGKAGGTGGYTAAAAKAEERINAKIGKQGKVSDSTQQDIDAAKATLRVVKQSYDKEVASSGPTSAASKALADAIKKKEEELARHRRTAANQIKTQQLQYAAVAAQKPKGLAKVASVAGNAVLLRGSAHRAGTTKAAQTFVDKARARKPTAEEKLSEAESNLRDKLAGSPAIVATIGDDIKKLDPNIIKDLPGEVLVNPNIMPHLDVSALTAIQNANKLNQAQRDDIAAHIRGVASFAAAPGTRAKKLADYLDSKGKGYW